MSDWSIAAAAWHDVQKEILLSRASIGCQKRSAWFRGVGNVHRDSLLPSLFRRPTKTVADLLQPVGITLRFVLRKSTVEVKQKLDHAFSSGRLPMQTLKGVYGIIDLAYERKGIKEAVGLSADTKRSAAQLIETRLANMFSSVLAEVDAYHEYNNRSHLDSARSWDVLAQMRHHSVPTRLLDWSESCNIALHFALKEYSDVLIPKWCEADWPGSYPQYPDTSALSSPGLWILNPFHLADLSGIQGAVPYPHHLPLKDYYQSMLIEKDWPYYRPIPIRAPRSDTRMESQRGNFTVHGTDTRPLEQQMPEGKTKSVLSCVRISREAAVYGAFHLWQFANFDTFEMMRDMDSLGRVVTSRHFNR